jgi:hypothetical protein
MCASNSLALTSGISGSSGWMATTGGSRATLGWLRKKRSAVHGLLREMAQSTHAPERTGSAQQPQPAGQ